MTRPYRICVVCTDNIRRSPMADPWYGEASDFDQICTEVVPAARGVVAHVRRELDR